MLVFLQMMLAEEYKVLNVVVGTEVSYALRARKKRRRGRGRYT